MIRDSSRACMDGVKEMRDDKVFGVCEMQYRLVSSGMWEEVV